jgi:pantetheine-phosphate adenylyltransferase
MTKVVCPGSFDPVTNGHLDIIERAARLFDEVVVAVLVNESKQGLFTIDERLTLLDATTGHLPNVSTATFQGLVVDFCTQVGSTAIVKGLRTAGDFEYELPQAHMNNRMTQVDTVFLSAAAEHAFVASSLVKVVAQNGGDVSAFVPDFVLARLKAKFA